jgi:lipoate-protein ligase A
MSADARLLSLHEADDDPILRIYSWRPWAVSYGHHQKPEAFLRAEIEARGWGFVRRPTGGRAILHAQELTYAVVGTSPSPLFGSDLHATYEVINRALLAFLRRLGLEPDLSEGESLAAARGAVCFQSAGRHEVTVGGKKIVGSAQRRTGDVFLQHGSILTGPAHAELLDCLPPAENTSARRAEVLAATTDLERLGCGPASHDDLHELATQLTDCFVEVLGLEPVRLAAIP